MMLPEVRRERVPGVGPGCGGTGPGPGTGGVGSGIGPGCGGTGEGSGIGPGWGGSGDGSTGIDAIVFITYPFPEQVP